MAEYEKETSTSTVFLAFLAGAALGAGFALLAAPRTGREMRDTISDLTDDAVTKIKQYASDVQSKLSSSVETGREMLRERKASVSSAVEEGRASMQ